MGHHTHRVWELAPGEGAAQEWEQVGERAGRLAPVWGLAARGAWPGKVGKGGRMGVSEDPAHG